MPNLTGVTTAVMEARAKSWVLHAQDRINQKARSKKSKSAAAVEGPNLVEGSL
jgi:hypothetical protein